MTFGKDGVESGIAASTFRGLAQEARVSAAFLPALKKPGLLRFWLLTARRAQAAAATALVLLLFVLPNGIHSVLEQSFPSRIVVGPTGTHTRLVDDDRLPPRYVAALAGGWMIALAVVGTLLWVHVPVAVVRAATESRRKEQEADRILRLRPDAAARLYAEAGSLASDPAHEDSLARKHAAATARALERATARARVPV